MDTTTVVTILSALIALASILGTATWAVGTIKGTTCVLGAKIDALAATIKRLDRSVENINATQADYEARIRVLEHRPGALP